MSLDKNDITLIRDTILDALDQVVSPRFDALEADVAELKADVAVLKKDMAEVKEDVRILKNDMRQVKSSLEVLEGKVEALEADVKEIYYMQAAADKATPAEKRFAKLTLEKKIRILHKEVLMTAKEAGVTL